MWWVITTSSVGTGSAGALVGVSFAVINSAYGRQSQGTVRFHLLDLLVSQYGVDMADHTDAVSYTHLTLPTILRV